MRKLSSLRARTIESLVGAGAGSVLGAGAGAAMYTPKNPVEWIDAQDRVQARSLTSKERAERKSSMIRAAMRGALGGTVASLGASKMRRSMMASTELKGLSGVGESYLSPLHSIVQKDRASYKRVSSLPAGRKGVLAKQLHRRVTVGEKLLHKQEGAVKGLLDDTTKQRDALLYGGSSWGKIRGRRVEIPQASHSRLVQGHFDSLAKANGLPSFNAKTRYSVFQSEIDRQMNKVAAAAFSAELRAIGLYNG